MSLEDDFSMPVIIECNGEKFIRFATYAPVTGFSTVISLKPKEINGEKVYPFAVRGDNDCLEETGYLYIYDESPDKDLSEFIVKAVSEYRQTIWRRSSGLIDLMQSLAYTTTLFAEGDYYKKMFDNPKKIDMEKRGLTNFALKAWNRKFNKNDKNKQEK